MCYVVKYSDWLHVNLYLPVNQFHIFKVSYIYFEVGKIWQHLSLENHKEASLIYEFNLTRQKIS